MYMILISLCRDAYSYDSLKIENSSFHADAGEAVRYFDRNKKDYKAYVDRREDTISMARLEVYQHNPETKAWDFKNEWEYKLPLKKLVVVNPELVKSREEKQAKKFATLSARFGNPVPGAMFANQPPEAILAAAQIQPGEVNW